MSAQELHLFTDTLEPVALPPYQSHSRTSRDAAASITPHLPRLQLEVLRYIANNQPCTDEAIQEGLGRNGNTIRPRRGELATAGYILPDGEAKTKSGRNAVCWRVTEAGRRR